jgi:hypothetical protein
MSSVREHVTRWREAGLLDEAAAQRILDFEAARREAPREAQGPGLLEAVLYLGVAVAAVGIVVLVAQSWDELDSWARVAWLAVPGVLALLAGLAMRATGQPGFARGGSVAWLVGVALAAGAAGVAADEAGWDVSHELLAAGVVAVVVALALWVVQPSHLQVIGMAGSLVLLSEALAAQPDDYSFTIAGVLIMMFGAIGIALTELSLLGPATSARILAGAGLVLGPYHAGFYDGMLWAELLVFVAGAVLIGLALWRSTFTYVVVGVLGTFVGLVTFTFKHFEDNLGAPVALMLSGALLVAAALLLGLFRRQVLSGRTS